MQVSFHPPLVAAHDQEEEVLHAIERPAADPEACVLQELRKEPPG
jgi:hypothetical protein